MKNSYEIQKIISKKTPNKKLANEMIFWGKIMGALNMVPYVSEKGWAGNMGFRENEIIWVTPSGGGINKLKIEEIVGITNDQNKIVYFNTSDKKPTSEWEIYYKIFKKRPEINAILHGHDLFALETAEKLNKIYNEVALTKSITGSGTLEFRDEILSILTKDNNYLIGKAHGFFSLGRDFEQAGILALDFRTKANKLLIGIEKYNSILNKYHIG